MNLSEDHNVPVKLEEMKSEPNRDGVNFNAVVGLLMSSAIGPQETLQFTYYQFTFQIVTALFRSEGLLNDSNATFYVGMLLNFMSILEATLSLDRDSSYIINLFQAIDYRIPSKTHSILFLVLNTFVEAAYDAETSGTKRIGPCRTRLGYEAIKYYSSK